MSEADEDDSPESLAVARKVWIIDTCSIIEVRRKVPTGKQPAVYRKLRRRVEDGSLLFPVEVFDELKRARSTDMTKEDRPFDFAESTKKTATRLGTDYAYVTQVLAVTPRVLDHEKVGGADEADPYVLALALKLSHEGHLVTVITEERKDRPDKMSMNTACGLLRLPCVPLDAFLESQGIWTPD